MPASAGCWPWRTVVRPHRCAARPDRAGGGYTSTVTAHVHRPAGSGAHRRPRRDADDLRAGRAGKHQEHDGSAVRRRPNHHRQGDLAVSIQPADDLIDHGHEQFLVAAGRHVPLGPGMRRPARDDGETVHQPANGLSDAIFPGRPHASIRRSAGCSGLRCPRPAPAGGPAIRCVMPIGIPPGHRTGPQGHRGPGTPLMVLPSPSLAPGEPPDHRVHRADAGREHGDAQGLRRRRPAGARSHRRWGRRHDHPAAPRRRGDRPERLPRTLPACGTCSHLSRSR